MDWIGAAGLFLEGLLWLFVCTGRPAEKGERRAGKSETAVGKEEREAYGYGGEGESKGERASPTSKLTSHVTSRDPVQRHLARSCTFNQQNSKRADLPPSSAARLSDPPDTPGL